MRTEKQKEPTMQSQPPQPPVQAEAKPDNKDVETTFRFTDWASL